MKISKLSRVYINQVLNENKSLSLGPAQLHYLQNVMRLKEGRQLRVFNETDGEFIATINNFTKKEVVIDITKLNKKPLKEAPLTLLISIIKPDKLLDAINMAVQIGVTEIIPIIAERSQSKIINLERLAKIIIEAAEQSERLSIPKYNSPIDLEKFLCSSNHEMIIYANESETDQNQMFKIETFPNNLAYLVGPEGGFSELELEVLKESRKTCSVSLGSNVLRAETAVAVGLAHIQLMREKCRL